MRTKLGNALIVALGTAFSNVQIAKDSELEKALAGARKSNFDKANARRLVLAMDSSIDPKRIDVVMDALVDVDDDPEPTKDCKECGGKDSKHAKDCKMGKDSRRAHDGESEEEREKREKKEAEDKRAADEEKKERAEDTKKAMDSMAKDLREQFKLADQAKRDVRPVVGDVIAQDSAAEIYTFALDEMKVEHAGVEGVPALKALFRLALDKRETAAPVVAMDHAAAVKRFPDLARFRQG